MIFRCLIYGLLGWSTEIVFTAIAEWLHSRDWRLAGTTYLWMFPIYALLGPLFEPVHDLLRQQPFVIRIAVWAFGITGVELLTGWLLAKAIGRCPWDYSHSRWAINPYIRWDYIPLWGLFGIGMEFVHDFLLHLTPFVYAYF